MLTAVFSRFTTVSSVAHPYAMWRLIIVVFVAVMWMPLLGDAAAKKRSAIETAKYAYYHHQTRCKELDIEKREESANIIFTGTVRTIVHDNQHHSDKVHATCTRLVLYGANRTTCTKLLQYMILIILHACKTKVVYSTNDTTCTRL